MVAMAMDAGGWNEAGQAVEELEGGEAKHFAAVHVGLSEPIHQASVWRGERPETVGGVEPLQGERPPGAVSTEPLESRSVLALDADGAVDGEPAGAAPCEHVCRRGGVQEPAAGKPPQDAELHRAGQDFRVSSLEASWKRTPCSMSLEITPSRDRMW
jgi:hypothetical protein